MRLALRFRVQLSAGWLAIERLRVGTPVSSPWPHLTPRLLLLEGVDIFALRKRSIALSEDFIRHFERRGPELQLVCRFAIAAERGSKSCSASRRLRAMQALIECGVISDFLASHDVDVVRLAPLFPGFSPVETAARMLVGAVRGRLWDRPEYRARNKVT